MALNEVTREEMRRIVAQLKEALHSHQQWHGRPRAEFGCSLRP